MPKSNAEQEQLAKEKATVREPYVGLVFSGGDWIYSKSFETSESSAFWFRRQTGNVRVFLVSKHRTFLHHAK
jgi:hypothetical protein